MKSIGIHEKLNNREYKAEDIAKDLSKDQTMLPEILSAVSSENPNIKFKSAKTLRLVSEKNPEILCPKIDFFINLLDSENNVIKWTAMDIIANLATVDTKNRFDKIFNKYYSLLSAKSMITIGHVIDNSAKIAKAKPSLTKTITKKLLQIEGIPTKPPITEECRNILIGKTIQAFEEYCDQIENKTDIISFTKRQLNNPRNATRTKAQRLLKKITEE